MSSALPGRALTLRHPTPRLGMVRLVLATWLFIAFWAILGIGLFFIAVRGGITGGSSPLQTQTRRGRRWIDSVFVIIFVGFGIALPVVILTGNHRNASAQVGGIPLNATEKAGRDLFAFRCGFCHTLAAANAVGKVGPNLDMLMPSKTVVLNTIANGCLPNAPAGSADACLGFGVMPAGILAGQQAQEVASFVSAVAGKE